MTEQVDGPCWKLGQVTWPLPCTAKSPVGNTVIVCENWKHKHRLKWQITSAVMEFFGDLIVSCGKNMTLPDCRLVLQGMKEILFFHTQLWFPDSDRDFRWFESDFRCFCEVSTGKNIVGKIESIMGAGAKQSSPSWVCFPQKSLAIARDFWNTNSLRWTPFRMGAPDGFSIVAPLITVKPLVQDTQNPKT